MRTLNGQSIGGIAIFLFAFTLMSAQAQTDPPPKPATAAKAHKRAAAPKVINQSSQETTRERERRLIRECKGRPNAGACLGFAS